MLPFVQASGSSKEKAGPTVQAVPTQQHICRGHAPEVLATAAAYGTTGLVAFLLWLGFVVVAQLEEVRGGNSGRQLTLDCVDHLSDAG